ncbi:AraC family transcriptional regulator [Burkholderia pseudomallei]|nr:AraC family transcriptional regulator [Burkholderia pseudomallei]
MRRRRRRRRRQRRQAASGKRQAASGKRQAASGKRQAASGNDVNRSIALEAKRESRPRSRNSRCGGSVRRQRWPNSHRSTRRLPPGEPAAHTKRRSPRFVQRATPTPQASPRAAHPARPRPEKKAAARLNRSSS